LESESNHPDSPIRFDPKLNEYHFVHGEAKMMIYHCPFCGGRAPKSRRSELFHRLTDAEQSRLCELTKDMRTLQDVMAALGEPDIKQPVGIVITKPERDGKPGSTQSYPVMIYESVSDVADVHVTIYPTDRVGISFQGKAVKRQPG
jgi:hypothetical protein